MTLSMLQLYHPLSWWYPNGVTTAPILLCLQPWLTTSNMINHFPCPIPGCLHSGAPSAHHFSSKSALLPHLNHDNYQHTFHLVNQSICSTIGIYSCCHASCTTVPTRFFCSLNDLSQHNLSHHPPPPSLHGTPHNHPPSTFSTPLDIGTSLFYSDAKDPHKYQKLIYKI